MKNFARFALIISLFAVCNSPTPSAPSSAAPSDLEDRWLNGSAGYARAVELQRELNVPLVVYFYADWCPYCHALDGQYLPSAPVQDYLRHVVKVRINPEQGQQERELAIRYGVTGYPTFLVMRTTSARPLKVNPFRNGGANWTPEQFANACRQAAPVSRIASTESNASGSYEKPKDLSARALNRATPRSQIVTVARTAAAPPEFIKGAALPTLDQVFAKYVEALGGRAAQMRLTSRVAKGTVDVIGISNGGRLESYAIAPNKSLVVMKIDPIGVMRQGFDGRRGWDQSEQSGLRASTGVSLASLARDAEFYRDLKLKELYARTRLLGKVKHGFREVYQVEATPRVGEPEMLYFDTQSGLLVRRDVTRQTSRGLVRAEIYLSDWRTIDGVKIPFKTTQTMPNQTFVFTLEEVKHNVPVDEAIFEKPAK